MGQPKCKYINNCVLATSVGTLVSFPVAQQTLFSEFTRGLGTRLLVHTYILISLVPRLSVQLFFARSKISGQLILLRVKKSWTESLGTRLYFDLDVNTFACLQRLNVSSV